MPLPAFIATGAVANATTAITPNLPAGLVANDMMIGLGESVGNESFVVPTGWAHVLGSPVNIDTTTRLTVIWRRFVGGDTALSWGDPGNHAVGRIIGYRGVVATGNPWDVAPTVTPDTTASTTATWPTLTTVTNDCLILFCIATGRDLVTTNLGAFTGGTGLGTITERIDSWVADGTGGGIGLAEASKVAFGSIGTVSATMGTNEPKAMMTLPLRPAPAPVGIPSLVTAR